MKRHGRYCATVLILTALVTAEMQVVAQSLSNAPFQILSLQPIFDPVAGSNAYVITWNAATGLVNNVTYTGSLNAPWQNLAGFLPYSPTTMMATDYPPTGTTQRFYQVKATTRPHIIMSLVLQRSGSMLPSGGSVALPPAVTNFISLFDDNYDYAAQVSFSSAASVDVPMEQPFITNIDNAVTALTFGGDSSSDQGLTNAVAQNNAMTLPPGQSMVKVIVFFTDGIDNTFNYGFNCGPRNIGLPNGSTPVLYDPTTGNPNGAGCTIPATLSSINPTTGALTSNAVDTTSCVAMHNEAQNRAEWIAWLARSQGNTIYCVGLGEPASYSECNGAFPILNPTFLNNIANTPDSETYDPSQPSGLSVVASDAGQLDAVFQSIAQQLFSQ